MSCNYNAAVVVNIPQWKQDERAVVFLGARPTAACDGDPAKLTLSFLLRNERGDGIEDGDRVRIAAAAPASQTLPLTTTGAKPTLAAGDVAVTLGDAALGADGGAGDADGGVGALAAQVTAIRYVPFTTGGRTDRRDPIAGALVLDNGYDVQADDAEGVRIDGATDLAEHALCTALGPDRCRFGAVAFELYDLADSNVAQLAPFLSDPTALRTKLDLLRDAARASGDGPVYDGLVKAAPEARQQAATLGAGAAAAVVLVTKDGRSESHATLDDTLAQVPGSPVFVITRQDTPELRRLACASGGVVRVVGAPADYTAAFAEVRDALRGRFEVDVDVPGLATAAPGEHQLAGTLGVTVGGVTASTAMSLAITKPGP
ncbi:MAG TPA: hypothetical protein VGQ83_15030 [Polyangia bacterium]